MRALYATTSNSYLLEPHKYQLRAYLYQARDLIPSDSSGLSGELNVGVVHVKSRISVGDASILKETTGFFGVLILPTRTTSCLSGRVLAFCVGGPGFKPRLGHTKDFLKMVPNAALLGTRQTRGQIWEVTLGEHCSQSLHAMKQGLSTCRMGRSARSTQLTSDFTCYSSQSKTKRIINDLIHFQLCLDPYVRLAFGNSSQATEMLMQTLCPTWDQTLIFENIPIYGNVEELRENPPHVVMELFDRDVVVSLLHSL